MISNALLWYRVAPFSKLTWGLLLPPALFLFHPFLSYAFCMLAPQQVYARACTNASTCTITHNHIYTHIYACARAHTHTHTHTHKHTHTNTHTHTYTHTQTHTHARMHIHAHTPWVDGHHFPHVLFGCQDKLMVNDLKEKGKTQTVASGVQSRLKATESQRSFAKKAGGIFCPCVHVCVSFLIFTMMESSVKVHLDKASQLQLLPLLHYTGQSPFCISQRRACACAGEGVCGSACACVHVNVYANLCVYVCVCEYICVCLPSQAALGTERRRGGCTQAAALQMCTHYKYACVCTRVHTQSGRAWHREEEGWMCAGCCSTNVHTLCMCM